MLPKPIPLLTGKQWQFLEDAMKRGPTPRMKAVLERAKVVYGSNPL